LKNLDFRLEALTSIPRTTKKKRRRKENKGRKEERKKERKKRKSTCNTVIYRLFGIAISGVCALLQTSTW
jgi:hypothetical protein